MAYFEHEPEKRIQIVIVDDEFPYRRGVSAILELYDDEIELCAEAGTADDAVRMVEKHCPDVALVDLRIPPASGTDEPPRSAHGIDAIRRIRAQTPHTHVLVLSHKEDPAILYDALRAGAHGYIAKRDLHHDDGGKRFAAIIRDMAAGIGFFGPAIASMIQHTLKEEPMPDWATERLTTREDEVLELIRLDYSNKDIARKLDIRESTVKTHVSNILSKLHARDRNEAAMIARLRQIDNGDA